MAEYYSTTWPCHSWFLLLRPGLVIPPFPTRLQILFHQSHPLAVTFLQVLTSKPIHIHLAPCSFTPLKLLSVMAKPRGHFQCASSFLFLYTGLVTSPHFLSLLLVFDTLALWALLFWSCINPPFSPANRGWLSLSFHPWSFSLLILYHYPKSLFSHFHTVSQTNIP